MVVDLCSSPFSLLVNRIAVPSFALVMSDIIKNVGKPSTLGSKEIKLRIIRMLEEKGVFQLKDSVPQVCELLGISQATLYNYLREVRTQGGGFLRRACI